MTALNQSKIKSFRRCQKQFAFRYDYSPEGKELVPKTAKVALYRGSWMHELQQELHRTWAGLDGDWRQVHKRLTKEFNSIFEEEREEYGDLPRECERMFMSYLRFWKDDLRKYSVVELEDGEPAVEFTVEIPLLKDHPFKGKIDLLVHDQEYGGIWIWDAKWVKRIPNEEDRQMSPQSTMYVWALRKMGYDVRGFLYNYGRTKAPTVPRVLKRGTLSLAKKMDTDVWTFLQAVKDLHGDEAKNYVRHVYAEKVRELRGREAMWFRRQRLPVTPKMIEQSKREFVATSRQLLKRLPPDEAPRTYQYDCRRQCEYHDLCVAEYMGMDIQPLIKRSFTFAEERYGESERDTIL